jgi:hypothetical protein
MKTGLTDNFVHHEESFDDYDAIINGSKSIGYRLLIFKGRNILYIADAKRVSALKKEIGKFRYGFTSGEYNQLS